jgi:hypothetical protein
MQSTPADWGAAKAGMLPHARTPAITPANKNFLLIVSIVLPFDVWFRFYGFIV